MTLLDVVIIALLQGVAEILPISASAHLALLEGSFTTEARAAVIAAADLGLVLALLVFLWRDLFAMGRSLVKLAKGKVDPGGKLLLQVLVGSMPALLLYWALSHLGTSLGRNAAAGAMVLFGLLLFLADRLGVTVRRVEHLGWLGAMVIGLLQALAIIPGVSRTGITITAARLAGFERQEAVRFSMLLGIPMVAGHAIITFWQVSHQTRLILSADLLLPAIIAAIVALISLVVMNAWVARRTFAPFALWRVVVGLLVLGSAFVPLP